MTHNPKSTLIKEVMEALSEHDSEGIARALSIILNAAMQVERQQAMGTAPNECSEDRKGHAKRFKDTFEPGWQDPAEGTSGSRRIGVLSLLD